MDAKMVKEFAFLDCVSSGHNSGTCNSGESSCNSRTCNNGKRVMLFGVDINGIPTKEEGTSIKRSVSMEVLGTSHKDAHDDPGYYSDGIIHHRRTKAAKHWKRGTPWTVEEHRSFLAGLKDLGKGDWKGIARNYVITRTSTQVASHAQKYYKRQANPSNKKRSSLFDIPLEPERYQAGLQLPSLSNNGATSSQASNMSQFTNKFSALCFPNSAVSGGQSCRELKIAQPPFVPMMNYHPSLNYAFKATNNSQGASHAPATTHPSGIPTPHPFPQTDPTASPITKNYRQLQIQ